MMFSCWFFVIVYDFVYNFNFLLEYCDMWVE